MKRLILLFFILFNLSSFSQVEPSPEEVMKYEWLMPLIAESNVTSPETLRILDSLYALDSNSSFLNVILGEATLRSISDSLRFERIPLAINIIQRLRKFDTTTEYTTHANFTLGYLYHNSGEYSTSIKYYEELLGKSTDEEDKQHVMNNLANVYKHTDFEKALKIIKQVPSEGRESLFLQKFTI